MPFSEYNPTNDDVVTKSYVDGVAAGIHRHISIIQGDLHGVRSLLFKLKPGIGWFATITLAIALNILITLIPTNSVYATPVDYIVEAEDVIYDILFIDDTNQSDVELADAQPTGDFKNSLVFNYMTPAQFGALNKVIWKHESANSGGYAAFSNYCYAGAHQFGAAMLTELGYMKHANFKKQSRSTQNGLGNHCSYMKDSNNWNIAGGLRTFLDTPAIQDAAFMKMIDGHIRIGIKNGVINDSTSAKRVGGFIMASQFGRKKSIRWYKLGINSHDGNRTKTSYYATRGETAVQNSTAADVAYLPSILKVSSNQTVTDHADVRSNAKVEKLLSLLEGDANGF